MNEKEEPAPPSEPPNRPDALPVWFNLRPTILYKDHKTDEPSIAVIVSEYYRRHFEPVVARDLTNQYLAAFIPYAAPPEGEVERMIERLRKHALPDPYDEREVMHAPLLRAAAALLAAFIPPAAPPEGEVAALVAQLNDCCTGLDHADKLIREAAALLAATAARRDKWMAAASKLHTDLVSTERDLRLAREALTELVACKDLKDRGWHMRRDGKPADEIAAVEREYAERKFKAWIAARAAIDAGKK